MRVCGSVEVSNRQLPSLNMTKKRAEWSYLSIGTFPGKNKEPFVLLQTLKNNFGVKYKVVGNVEGVFTRYVNDGKITLRFKSPPHDLIVNCPSSVGDLKAFLKALKICLDRGNSGSGGEITPRPAPGQLGNLAAAPNFQPKPKTKCSILLKEDYPHLKGFPRSLEFLKINGIEMTQLDRRILRLQNLCVLNLENNRLGNIPREIDLLPNLRELYLAKNCLGAGGLTSWVWMSGRYICNKLQVLDLRNNQLVYLPKQIVKLRGLKSLLLDNNKIEVLPNGIGLLSNLQEFHISHNCLLWLPGSCRKLKLCQLDVSYNCPGGLLEETPSCCLPIASQPHSLVDLSAQTVLDSRLHYSEELLPRTLIDYLEEGCYCECGRSTYPPVPEGIVPFRLRRISTSISFTGESSRCIYLAVRYCRRTNCPRNSFPSVGFIQYHQALEGHFLR